MSSHALYERQEIFTCEGDLEIISNMIRRHKLNIEIELAYYYRKRASAQEHPNHICIPFIIDGMSQDHFIVPYYAGRN